MRKRLGLILIQDDETAKQGSKLRLTKVDIEHAGMTSLDLFHCNVCLVREEYIFRFHFSHNIAVPLDHLMTNVFAVDHLIHLDRVR